MHSKGYVHADIKGANLLLGRQKGTENQVYLVDFGLAARYTNVPKADPRRAHNGTIEYTSRDGHEGSEYLQLFHILFEITHYSWVTAIVSISDSIYFLNIFLCVTWHKPINSTLKTITELVTLFYTNKI